MYTVARVTHEGPDTGKHGVWAYDGTLFATCDLRGEAQMVTDALNETDKRLVDALAEVSRLRADQLDLAERSAKAMRWECVKVAENYLTGREARHIAGAMDLLDAPAVARRAVGAGDAHDKMLDALNEMAADLGRGRYIPPAPQADEQEKT